MLARMTLALIVLLNVLTLAACRMQRAPNADQPLSAAQARQELQNLYEGLQKAHYDLYARRPREQYDALYRQMREQLNAPIALPALRRELQRFTAFGNIAHARIDPPAADWEAYRVAGGKAFALSFRVVGTRVYIMENYSGMDGVAVGDEVLSIDGVDALAWLSRFRTWVSADNDYLAYTQLENALPMLVWWSDLDAESYRIEIKKADQTRQQYQVPARSRTEFQAALSAQPQRFELDWNARIARMESQGVAYLRPGPFYDNRPEATNVWDPSGFKAFVDDAFRNFIAQDAKAVLIDLRNNPGGDNSFSDPLIAWFATEDFRFTNQFDIRVSEAAIASNAKRLQAADDDSTSTRLAQAYAGKALGSEVNFPIPWIAPRSEVRFRNAVYLLINRHSYSNTVVVAAIAQDYGFATLLGEETSDLASTYGASEKFTLPETGIEVTFPKAQILRPNGNPAPRGVIPDIAMQEPVAASAEDLVLKQALQLVASRSEKP